MVFTDEITVPLLSSVQGAKEKRVPRFLYHGTNLSVAKLALKEGLKTAKKTGKDNWKHTITSNKDNVYLTTIYGYYFALAAIREFPIPEHPGRALDEWTPAVIEVDLEKLKVENMRPDEDALEQITRGLTHANMPPAGLDMFDRTMWYRERLDMFQRMWPITIQKLGTCGHNGNIPPSSISRVSIVPDVRAAPLAALETLEIKLHVNYHKEEQIELAKNIQRWLLRETDYENIDAVEVEYNDLYFSKS
jgi:hypothetical protein